MFEAYEESRFALKKRNALEQQNPGFCIFLSWGVGDTEIAWLRGVIFSNERRSPFLGY